MTGCQTEMRC